MHEEYQPVTILTHHQIAIELSHVDYDNGTAEFEQSWKFHEDHIFPKLKQPHQQVLLNPGIWADDVPWCSANNLSGRPEPGVGPDKVGRDVRGKPNPHTNTLLLRRPLRSHHHTVVCALHLLQVQTCPWRQDCPGHAALCTLDHQAQQVVDKLELWFEKAKTDSRIAGFMPVSAIGLF